MCPVSNVYYSQPRRLPKYATTHVFRVQPTKLTQVHLVLWARRELTATRAVDWFPPRFPRSTISLGVSDFRPFFPFTAPPPPTHVQFFPNAIRLDPSPVTMVRGIRFTVTTSIPPGILCVYGRSRHVKQLPITPMTWSYRWSPTNSTTFQRLVPSVGELRLKNN